MNNPDYKLEEPWTISLFGEFCLTSPSGGTVKLANRKAEAMLAMLVVNRLHGVSRNHAAQTLWPTKSASAQSQNLRQVLTLLRKTLGPEAIIGDRSHCQLGSSFEFESDFEDTTRPPGLIFMPGHEGEWFDDIRVVSELEPANEEPVSRVLSGYVSVLEHLCNEDPGAMFGVMRESHDLAYGLRCDDVLRLTRRARPTPEWAGWRSYWLGSGENDLTLCAQLLEHALDESDIKRDSALAVYAVFELGKVYSRLGKVDRARELCSISKDLATKADFNRARSYYLRLKGTVLVHWGDAEQGLKVLESAESWIREGELARAKTTRAFFEASLGNVDRARKIVAEAKRLALESEQGPLLGVVAGCAEALVDIHEGNWAKGQEKLATIADEASAAGLSQFVVYAEELRSRLFTLDGDFLQASNHAKIAKRERLASQMAVTKLERTRLALISAKE